MLFLQSQLILCTLTTKSDQKKKSERYETPVKIWGWDKDKPKCYTPLTESQKGLIHYPTTASSSSCTCYYHGNSMEDFKIPQQGASWTIQETQGLSSEKVEDIEQKPIWNYTCLVLLFMWWFIEIQQLQVFPYCLCPIAVSPKTVQISNSEWFPCKRSFLLLVFAVAWTSHLEI